ncbi:carbohydrate ABC transporter permease [Cohnella luojiensis]|uniref:Sugar ABC transporter permease n=1 Tax=Cohnella luojiensis TaxID=652876 RepID=A0A4Y8M2R1_9BACL|nr:sugar ABC transporter permease [Cohnella luojiensis]TFE28612.1 sugar ABC transporter permease [Cohnella luojiensis]
MGNIKRLIRAEMWYLLFLLPGLCLFIFAVFVPLVMGARYSFTSWDGLSRTVHYTGWDNYVRAFSDSDLWIVLVNTFKYAIIVTVLVNAISLLLALLLDTYLKFRNAFRTIFFLPGVISIVLSGFIWKYNYAIGFPSLFGMFGLDISSPLGDPNYALFGLILIAVWQGIGAPMIIYIAGLQGVSSELVESAKIDGANARQSFFRIILPLIAPSITINMLLVLTGSLKVFDLVYVTTQGGPAFSTEVISTFIYKSSFANFQAGYGTALSMIFFLILVLVTIVQISIFRRREVEM